jgi:hypothetical protein
MVETTLSIAALRKHDACRLDERIADIESVLNRDVPEDEEIPLSSWTRCFYPAEDWIWYVATFAPEYLPDVATTLRDLAREIVAEVAEIVPRLAAAGFPEFRRYVADTAFTLQRVERVAAVSPVSGACVVALQGEATRLAASVDWLPTRRYVGGTLMEKIATLLNITSVGY